MNTLDKHPAKAGLMAIVYNQVIRSTAPLRFFILQSKYLQEAINPPINIMEHTNSLLNFFIVFRGLQINVRLYTIFSTISFETKVMESNMQGKHILKQF